MDTLNALWGLIWPLVAIPVFWLVMFWLGWALSSKDDDKWQGDYDDED